MTEQLPVNQSAKMFQALQVANMLNQGEPLLLNPMVNPGNSYGSTQAALRGQAGGMQSGLTSSHPAYYLLGKIDTTLGASNTQVSGLVNHGNMMLFGSPTSGSIIAGGLQANLGLAMAAIALDNTLGANGGPPAASSGGGDPCQLIQEMFGTLLGKGQELIADMMTALNNTPIAEFIRKVGDMINEASGVVALAIAEISAAIEAGLAEVRRVMDEIATTIADELSQFGEWISKQLNFNLASFLSGLFDNPCFRLVVSAVGAAPLLSTLQQTPASVAPYARAPGLWSRRAG